MQTNISTVLNTLYSQLGKFLVLFSLQFQSGWNKNLSSLVSGDSTYSTWDNTF